MEPSQDVSSSCSIMIVEDDDITRSLINVMIAKTLPGLSIHVADNGRTGLDLFEKHAPDIVITDINMPVMDGIEMAREIKSLKADTKFIVMTAYSDKRFFESFSEIGFSDYLSKPIILKKLMDAIRRCLTDVSSTEAVAPP